MKLPNAAIAHIPQEKLTDYLLSMTHPIGKAKAVVLRQYGFYDGNVNSLEDGLLAVACTQEVIDITLSSFGTKYVIDGILPTPDGRRIMIRTVWMIDIGRDAPRFVTAYPQ